MAPYVIMMTLSCLSLYLAFNAKFRYSSGRRVFVIFGLLAPCVLAACRDVTVGTDVLSYVVKTVDFAETHSLPESIIRFTAPNIPEIEPLYIFFTYVIAQFTNSISVYLFVIEFACVFFLYEALKELVRPNKIWFGFFIFYMLFYGFSLNLMRQVIVMCLGLWGLKYIKEHMFKRYIIIGLAMFFVHRTAVIMFLIYFLYPFVTGHNIKNKFIKNLANSNRVVFDGLLIVGSSVVVLFAGKLITLIATLTGSFQYQALHVKSYFTIIPSHLLFMSVFILLSLFFLKHAAKNNRDVEYYCVLSILAVILWQVQGISREAYRMALYFWIFVIPYLTNIVSSIKHKKNALIVEGVFMVLAAVYFYYFTVISGMNAVYPYTSEIFAIY